MLGLLEVRLPLVVWHGRVRFRFDEVLKLLLVMRPFKYPDFLCQQQTVIVISVLWPPSEWGPAIACLANM